MYELKCPNCAHVVRDAFIRVGAVVDCPACAKRYRVTDSLVSRRIRTPTPHPEVSHSVLTPSDTPEAAMAPDGQETPRVDAEGNVIGLSGLSEVMKGQPRVTPEPGDPQPIPQAAKRQPTPVEATGPATARHHAREAERKRRRYAMYLLLVVLVGAVAVLGGGLLLASRMAGDGVTPGGSGLTASDDPTAPGVGADPRVISNDLPLLHAERLDLPHWANIDRPFVEPTADPDIRLIGESLATSPAGERSYIAQVVTDRRELVTEAHVVLSLVDLSRDEVVRAEIGLTLLDANHPQQIRIPLIEGFDEKRLAPVAHVRVKRRSAEAVFLEPGDLRLTPFGRGRQTAVHVIAFNPLDAPLDGLTFQFTAVDRLERPIARWRARWDQPMAARQRIEFQALTPLPDDTIVQTWHIEAAGR